MKPGTEEGRLSLEDQRSRRWLVAYVLVVCISGAWLLFSVGPAVDSAEGSLLEYRLLRCKTAGVTCVVATLVALGSLLVVLRKRDSSMARSWTVWTGAIAFVVCYLFWGEAVGLGVT